MHTSILINYVFIIDKRVETGSLFLMLSTAQYNRLLNELAIQPFITATFDVVKISSANAEICNLVNVLVDLDGTALFHLLVIKQACIFYVYVKNVFQPNVALPSRRFVGAIVFRCRCSFVAFVYVYAVHATALLKIDTIVFDAACVPFSI